MKNILMCGYFNGNNGSFGGQSAKTINIYNQLVKNGCSVDILDTYYIKKRFISFFFKCIFGVAKYKHIIVLPASNGIKIFVPLFVTLKKLFKFKLHYAVVGGWLPEYLKENKWLIKYMQKIDFIYPETEVMKNKLSELDIKNVHVMANFKNILPIEENEIKEITEKPFRFCTFSRILKEKGIEDAINAVKAVNEEAGDITAALDIYGVIDDDYKEEFENILNKAPEYIKYCGIAPAEKSIETIKDYYALLFPTYYSGEGFAGTLIDAFSAGLPVISTDWRYNTEIVNDGVTGFIYSYKEKHLLKEAILKACNNPELINKMRYTCLEESKKYLPEIAVLPLYNKLI